MATARKATKKSSKDAKPRDLGPRKIDVRTAGQLKGGRRDKLASNHNQTVRSR
jgi:hypothetical protein